MNRRQFLTSSLRGLILGAAMSSGLGKAALALPEAEYSEISADPSDPLGQRGYIDGYIVTNKSVILNSGWMAKVEQSNA